MMTRMSLDELCAITASRHLPLAAHSAKARPGGIFVVMPAAVPAERLDETPGGERFLREALAAGPGHVVSHPRHLERIESLAEAMGLAFTLTLEEDVRAALGRLAGAFYGAGGSGPKVIGITGTNGKTTESYLLEALFTGLGRKTGVIGTVSYRWPGHEEDAPLTTPGCLELHAMLARMAKAGVEYVFMEVSSHSLDQQRIAGIGFSGALLTNVTQDHLDYHKDMEDYFAAKAKLFLPQSLGGFPFDDKATVINSDDAFGRRLLDRLPGALGFGLDDASPAGSRRLAGSVLAMSPAGLRLAMDFEGERWEISSPLVGSFNAMNLLGAQAMGLALGLEPGDFMALEGFPGVSGRLERVPGNRGLNVFVDYAHTPDALVKAISALRASGFSRIVTVFGCGGNRDRSKRPLMGEAVAAHTDVAVLTSDNPRDEDPEAIIADVLPGLAACSEVVTRPDRRAALAEALALVGSADALLVAGKGHETYQLIKGVKHPFSDQAILRELMR